jgi:protein arginine N-methyltransferase 1
VYAIEPSDVVQILAAAARDNGLADRIVVLPKRSSEVVLPERADLIVSDLRGVLPPFQTHFADIADARDRLLAPGGRLIPETDTMMLGVVSAPEAFERTHRPWQSGPQGLDLRAALPFVENTWIKHRARAEDLLSVPVPWARLSYPKLDAPQVRGDGTVSISRDGTAHGLLIWFDTDLVPGVGYSNAPGAPEGIYGQILLPWPEAVALRERDLVTFEVRADPGGPDFIWTWTTEIRRASDGNGPSRRFRQSTFGSMPLSPDSVGRRAATFVPALSANGEVALRVLEGLQAGKTIGALATEVQAAYPGRFRRLDDAHGFVADLAERYGA